MRSPLCVRASEKNVQIGKRKDGRLAKCCTFDAIVTSEQHDAFLLHLRRKLASPFCSLLSLVRVGKDGYIMDGHHRASRGSRVSYIAGRPLWCRPSGADSGVLLWPSFVCYYVYI